MADDKPRQLANRN